MIGKISSLTKIKLFFKLSEFLVRLARALQWSECSTPPSPGHDTTILAETLKERAERLAAFHDHHAHGECGQKVIQKNCFKKISQL